MRISGEWALVSSQESDYYRLLALTLRLLDHRHRRIDHFPRSYPKDRPQLFVGTLPPAVDIGIPIPDEAQVLGTVHMETHSEILLDVALSTKRVLRFYEERLHAAGWTAHHHAGNRWNGFQHHAQPDVALGNFDQGHLGPALNVVAWGNSDMTDLCLYLNTEIVPEQPDHRDSHPRPQDSCIPGLSAPPETAVEPQGGQFSPERADSCASIATNLDLVSINDHYSAQLRDAGWILAEQASDTSLVLTTWRFTYRSHQYSATMELAKGPGCQIAAHIHAAQEAST